MNRIDLLLYQEINQGIGNETLRNILNLLDNREGLLSYLEETLSTSIEMRLKLVKDLSIFLSKTDDRFDNQITKFHNLPIDGQELVIVTTVPTEVGRDSFGLTIGYMKEILSISITNGKVELK